MPTEKQLKYWESLRGKTWTDESRKKLSETNKKRGIALLKNLGEYTKKGRVSSFKGKKQSIEARIKMSEMKRGKTAWNKGKRLEKLAGKNHWNWQGGITPANQRIRHSFEYRLWREAVFKRDNWTCVWCFQKGGNLNADHIKPFALFPELRFAIDNGRILCKPCHLKTDTYSNRFIKLNKIKQ